MALTDVKIRAAKPAEKAYRLADGGGLYLLIPPSGGKLWRWNYRFSGKQKTMPLGKYPDVSLADARTAHQTARIELFKGNDPMAQRKAERDAAKATATQEQAKTEEASDAHSFKAVALKWHEKWAPSVGINTAAYILRRLEADVFPAFGNKPITEVRPSDIRNLILAIEQGNGKGRRFEGTGARDVAQRQHGTISQIFRYAIAHELADSNPAAAFKPSDVLKARKTQHRARVETSQLPQLLMAIDDFPGHKVWRYALKLMSMLFVRTNELLEAPLTEFDLDNARWVITAERMKMDRPHIVPLPRQAVSILRELFSLAVAENKTFVFPGMNKQTENGTLNENTLLLALEEIGYKGIMTGHGFRGLASTILHENGFEEAHIELQLSHAKKNKVAASYDYAKYIPQRTELMQWWADYLDAGLSTEKAKVEAIRKTA
jgi:integrase